MPTQRQSARFGAPGLPVRFEEVSRVRHPGKKATAEEIKAWKQKKKKSHLSKRAVQTMHALRSSLDAAGGLQREVAGFMGPINSRLKKCAKTKP